MSNSYQNPKVESLLGLETPPGYSQVQYNAVLKRTLSNTIHVYYRDDFLVDGSTPSKSVAAITTTKSGYSYDWRGPIIASGMVGLGIDQTFCKDLDMNDFRHVADYFISYGHELAPANLHSIGIKVKGVRINCIGDEKMGDKPHFERVEIPLTDPIFSYHDTSDIAERIGLPILTRPEVGERPE